MKFRLRSRVVTVPTEPETYLYMGLALLLLVVWLLHWKMPARCDGCGHLTSSPLHVEMQLCPPCARAHHASTFRDESEDDGTLS